MKKIFAIVAVVALAVSLTTTEASARPTREQNRQEVLNRGRGYYKDILMDSGVGLACRRTLPVADALGLEMEYFLTPPKKEMIEEDQIYQVNVVLGTEEDTNGWLLYPDGAPRYRMIFVNGGSAGYHARSFPEEARNRFVQFVNNGGSYVGTCAGAYFGSAGGYSSIKHKSRNTHLYLGVWPGYTHSTNIRKTRIPLAIPKRSPLLKYSDFGSDNIVEVYHNGGCFYYDGNAKPAPDGTESLATYNTHGTPKVDVYGKTDIWAYKANAKTGRVILCGSHPEGAKKGERLELMSAMVLYAIDGNSAPQVKGTLKGGQVREMNKRTEDNDPKNTRIGDKQYHHFLVNVPRKCKQLKITLEGYEGENGYDLFLSAQRNGFAYTDTAFDKVVSAGCDKVLVIDKPKAGKWYVSVFCDTTVDTETGRNGFMYVGNKGVLNGVPYKVSVEY